MAEQRTKSPAPTRRARSVDPLKRFIDKHALAAHVATAQRLATDEFSPVSPPRLELQEDPETAAQWVEIGLTVPGDPPQVLEAYNRYTRRWLASAPSLAVEKIRLAYEVV